MGALPDLDLARIRRYCEDRSPAEFRDKVRLEVEVRDKAVTIVDRRLPWDGSDTEWTREPICRFRYEENTSTWIL